MANDTNSEGNDGRLRRMTRIGKIAARIADRIIGNTAEFARGPHLANGKMDDPKQVPSRTQIGRTQEATAIADLGEVTK